MILTDQATQDKYQIINNDMFMKIRIVQVRVLAKLVMVPKIMPSDKLPFVRKHDMYYKSVMNAIQSAWLMTA